MIKDKAPFRKVKVTFWDDEQISEDLTPEDRYFYLYLMTNPFTSQLGIYTITRKQIANHLGYGVETAENLIKRFEEYHGLIKYNRETKEMALLKWSKHNWNVGGAPVWDLIKKEIESIKDQNLIHLLLKNASKSWLTSQITLYLSGSDDSYHDSYHDTGYKKEELRTKNKELRNNKDIKSTNVDLEEQFNTFWDLYAKKVGKKKCVDKFKKVLKDVSFDELIKGVERYNADLKRRNSEQFKKDPLTFLNGAHWEDEYQTGPKINIGSHTKQNNGGNEFETDAERYKGIF